MLKKTYTILAVALTTTACGVTVESSEPDTSNQQLSGDQAACDKNALNNELGGLSLEEAVAEHDRYRCLCDDEGYPLVGNINGKVITTASEVCAALKEKDLL